MSADDLGLRQLADDGHDAVIDLRRDLHAHPELADEETRTSAVLRERVLELGWTPLACPTPTGLVAELRGGGPGRSIMLRADIDALPIQEESDVTFASGTNGVMHACGHDGHAAILVGVAAALAARAEDLSGRYVAVFQPAEELGGGARRMIEGGLLETAECERVVGLHVSSSLATGLVGHRAGIGMSAAQPWRIVLGGRGGHAATGGAEGNVVAAASVVVERLAAVVAGLEHEGTPCVCSATVIRAGTVSNVVPRRATVEGTLRTFTAEQQELALRRLRALCSALAEEIGVDTTLELAPAVPAVSNDATATATVADAVADDLGTDAVVEIPPAQPSDDVSEFLLRLPGTYLIVGARPGRGVPPQHHAPDFAIDEEGLRVGALALLRGAVALASGGS